MNNLYFQIKNYLEHLNKLRLIQKDKAYMKYQADAYTEAALYLMRVIQKQNKKNPLAMAYEQKALSTAVNQLLARARELNEMEKK
jgi:ribonuclease HIII